MLGKNLVVQNMISNPNVTIRRRVHVFDKKGIIKAKFRKCDIAIPVHFRRVVIIIRAISCRFRIVWKCGGLI
ncbi:hypothetical protein D3C87_1306370 [compost metagenome]